MKKLLTLALAVLMCVFAISAMADTVSCLLYTSDAADE